ncbi:DUF418 domain-containing protein [Parapedobacter koreensis]|uniref:DUF418 domain-containing protein n=1 Tax=Parapedobacter koreensis TaxID=332977 RepID=A0A1H7SJK8_9SPHI|nr:DUF418 domain-containing protein [Parapedobacter koreensis]SEL72820.1 uncharacterized protein SAMN05421740_10923 [Parapedobacter koreensis]
MNQSINQRVFTVDIIRGIALLGILIFNIQTYTLFAFLRPGQVYALHLDRPETYAPVQFLIHVFIKGQFYTIYSFLFGLSFHLMMQKSVANKLDGDGLFKRRLWFLLFLGLVHAFIFWFGDVLHKYALLGFTLLYFNKKSVRSLKNWIIAISLASVAFQVLSTIFLSPSAAENAAHVRETDSVVMMIVETWQHGTLIDILRLQKLGVAMLYVLLAKSGLSNLAHYEIMFLLGLIAGKLDLFSQIGRYRQQMKTAAVQLLPLGLALKCISCLEFILPLSPGKYAKLFGSLCTFVGTPILTIIYLIFLVIALQNIRSRFWQWIANAGRLGLTNYLSQTLICMVLFYGYGFGLSGKLTLLGATICAVVIYAVQVMLSTLWLRYYQSGPLERLWRWFIYRQHYQKTHEA